MAAQTNPAEIAREVFRLLASRRIAPTPDAYHDAYHEIAGTSPKTEPELVLQRFVKQIGEGQRESKTLTDRIARDAEAREWEECEQHLLQLADRLLRPVTAPATALTATSGAALTASASLVKTPVIDTQSRDLLIRVIGSTLKSLLQASPELAQEAEAIANAIRDSAETGLHSSVIGRVKQLDFKIEMRENDADHQRTLLLNLLRLLLDNVKELIEDDRWLAGQIASVQALLAGPVDAMLLKEALRSLKDVVFKQGVLKHSLTEVKSTFKTMMLTFIDRVGNFATTTDEYHQKMDGFASQINQAEDISSLNHILADVMRETRTAQNEALRSRDMMVSVRNDVHQAEAKIQALQQQLVQMSELVHEDQLTGSLNRRGMDDVLTREMARAERRGTNLCVALLDLDDFKKINDTHGHVTGDRVLVHLVKVVKETLRSLDIIARFGGEEFLIVLPDTGLEEAASTITRVQRELTKQIFMFNDERLLITFSAGVALRTSGEEQAHLIVRADQALYQAKAAGKNRVVTAPHG